VWDNPPRSMKEGLRSTELSTIDKRLASIVDGGQWTN